MKRISKKRRSLDGKKILIFAAIAAITIAIIVIASVDAFSMLVPDNEENGNSASNIANGGMERAALSIILTTEYTPSPKTARLMR